MRVPLKGLNSKLPSSLVAKKGYQYMRYPRIKIQAVRFTVLVQNSEVVIPLLKLIAFPTANKKAGKTRSVGVKPCQLAWSKGANGVAPVPGVFTMIMKQTVMPLNTSRERNRVLALTIPIN